MKTETSKKGFTLAELLTAITIIAILIGILLPALNMARNFAKVTRQKVQIGGLDTAVNMFYNDFQYYPPSHGVNGANQDYTYYGAQTLAEAMFGYDLMGFLADSHFDQLVNLGNTVYDSANPANLTVPPRKLAYIDKTNLGVFKLRDVFQTGVDNKYLICDTFDVVSWPITLANGTSKSTKNFKMGTPILYYRANTSNTDINPGTTPAANRIYDYKDNEDLVKLGTVKDGTKKHTEFSEKTGAKNFLTYIEDPMTSTTAIRRPVRPDSFLLISAGPDGLYGNSDDICNFDPNTQ